MIVAVVLAVIAVLILLSTYNGLMHHRQEVRRAWSRLDEQLKRRYGLLPTLMRALQAADGEAAALLKAVTIAKNQAAVAVSPEQLASAETALSAAIQKVLAAAQQDSSLRENGDFVSVSRQLIDIESVIAKARYGYNVQVHSLNAAMHSFPSMLTARLIGLQEQPYFEVSH